MITCANCTSEAAYSYRVNDALITHYCTKHLPHFLYSKKSSGEIALVTMAAEPEKPSKKKKEQAVAEPVEEESTSADADN